MPFTNAGAQLAILRIGSGISNFIGFYAIGSGSGTALVTNATLISESGVRIAITGSPDFSTARKVTFVGDWSANLISGLAFREFGLFDTITGVTGSAWFRSAFPALTFDGSNELSMTTTIEAIPG